MYDEFFVEDVDLDNAMFWQDYEPPFKSIAQQSAEYLLGITIPREWRFAALDGTTMNNKIGNIVIVREDGKVARLDNIVKARQDAKTAKVTARKGA